MGSFNQSCPFARVAADLLAHAVELDPSRPAAPIAEVAQKLVAQGAGSLAEGSAREIKIRFGALEVLPYKRVAGGSRA